MIPQLKETYIPAKLEDDIRSIIMRALEMTYKIDPKSKPFSDANLLYDSAESSSSDDRIPLKLLVADPDHFDFSLVAQKIDMLKTLSAKCWRTVKDNTGHEYIIPHIPANPVADEALSDLIVGKNLTRKLAWIDSRGNFIEEIKIEPLTKKSSSRTMELLSLSEVADYETEEQNARRMLLESQRAERIGKRKAQEQMMRDKGYRDVMLYDKAEALAALKELGINVRITSIQ